MRWWNSVGRSFPKVTPLLLVVAISGHGFPRLALRCLEYVCERNIPYGEVQYVLRNPVLDDRFYRLAMSRGSILVGSSTQPAIRTARDEVRYLFDEVTHYIMLFETVDALDDELRFLDNSTDYRSRAFFILLFLDHWKGCSMQSFSVASVFETLWQRYIHNTILIYCPEGITSHQCSVYTWFPYAKFSSCAANFFNYDQIDRCSLENNSLQVEYLNQPKTVYDLKFPSEPAPAHHEFASQEKIQSISVNSKKQQQANCFRFVPNRAFFTGGSRHKSNFSLPLQKSTVPLSTFELRSHRQHLPPPNPELSREDFLQAALAKHPTDFHPSSSSSSSSQSELISPDKAAHFFHKVPDDLGGCEVRALLAIWPPFVTDPNRSDWIGMEHKLLLDVARFMNFRLLERYAEVGRHSGRMARPEAIGEFRNSSAQLFFGNLYPHSARHSEFDHSVGYLQDDIVWVVPLAAEQPLWRNLASAFSTLVWILVIITVIAFVPLLATITDVVECPRHSLAAIDVFGIFMAMSLRRIPLCSLSRGFFILWSLYSVHVSIFYQSKMIDILTRTPTGHQIDTLDELVASGMPIGFPENFLIHLERLNSSAIEGILRRRIECTSESCLTWLAGEDDGGGGGSSPFATLGNRMYLRYSAAHQPRPPRFYVLNEIVAKSFIQIVMKKGLPLRDHINKKIRSMVEAGYLTAVSRVFKANTANASRAALDSKPRHVHPLQLEHFQGAFFMFALGCALSVLALFSEILTQRTLLNPSTV